MVSVMEKGLALDGMAIKTSLKRQDLNRRLRDEKVPAIIGTKEGVFQALRTTSAQARRLRSALCVSEPI